MIPDTDRPRIAALLDFWFAAGTPEWNQPRKVWWVKDPAFDEDLRQRFLDDHLRAASGALASWQDEPESCLALVLLLDQLPRNLFRGSPRAFATDPLAREVAGHALARGFDREMPKVRRSFLYLPFEHSESLADQHRCVRLFEAMAETPEDRETARHAHLHRDIVARVGRFPHRNAVLGRETTPEEAEFLKEPGSSF